MKKLESYKVSSANFGDPTNTLNQNADPYTPEGVLIPSTPSSNNPVPPNSSNTPVKSNDSGNLYFPQESNFDNSILKTSPLNDKAAINKYLDTVDKTLIGFNLMTDADKIAQQFQTLDKNTLEDLRLKATQKKESIAVIPVPRIAVGIAQRYYLIYQYYQDFITQVQKIVQGNQSATERQQSLDTAKKIHGQLGATMENLGVDLNKLDR